MNVEQMMWWWEQAYCVKLRDLGIDPEAKKKPQILTPDRERLYKAYPGLKETGIVRR